MLNGPFNRTCGSGLTSANVTIVKISATSSIITWMWAAFICSLHNCREGCEQRKRERGEREKEGERARDRKRERKRMEREREREREREKETEI